MINELNNTFEKVNKMVGVDMKLPTPTKKKLNSASVFTATVGTTLLIVGVVTSSKWSTMAGSISLLSSILQRKESKNFK